MKAATRIATKGRAAPSQSARDPRTEALLRAFRRDTKLAPIAHVYEKHAGAGKFGSNGLKVNGKLFALFTQGTLVVKLPSERVTALVAEDAGKLFDPGRGRLMKGWLTITSATASWIDLAREAYEFVKGTKR